MTKRTVSILISDDVAEQLASMRRSDESWDDVVMRLITERDKLAGQVRMMTMDERFPDTGDASVVY